MDKDYLGKKGQVEITETLVVLLVIVIIIILGIGAYYGFFYRSLGSLEQEKTDVENLILLNNFASLPEVKCSKENCVDIVKLFSFKELIKENKAYYFQRFNDKVIVVESVYPMLNLGINEKECTLSEFQQVNFPENCGFVVVYNGFNLKDAKYSVSLPVSLYFSKLNQYRIGLLKVYEK
ncbi:hypothetical protein HYX16_03935 [Candidatus Woesearchaeota archaeon]|nr:hypothetical protein [Candidatus Woesearchaeota archaeon]